MPDIERGRGLKELRFLLNDSLIVTGKRLVDIGCGQGRVLLQAEKEGAKSCLGIDADFGVLRKHWGINFSELWHRLALKERMRSEVMHVRTCESLPLKDSCADIVICSFVFPYVTDKLSLLREVLRILAPGGRAYIVNASAHTYYNSMARGWATGFLLIDAKERSWLERLKGIIEQRELTYSSWRREKDPDAAEFGAILDRGIGGSADIEEVIGMKIHMRLVSFYYLFAAILPKSRKIKVSKSGFGFIIEKSPQSTKKDTAKAIARIEKFRKYHLMDINLKHQDKLRPLPVILSVFDSRVLD